MCKEKHNQGLVMELKLPCLTSDPSSGLAQNIKSCTENLVSGHSLGEPEYQEKVVFPTQVLPGKPNPESNLTQQDQASQPSPSCY